MNDFIQPHYQLKEVITEFSELLFQEEWPKGQIQKISSSPHFIQLSIRFLGQTKWFLLGRGGRFEGFYPISSSVGPGFRIIDQWTEYLRKHLRGRGITSLEVDPQDRAITLWFRSKSDRGVFVFFWKGRNFYFQHIYCTDGPMYLFSCLEPKKKVSESFDEGIAQELNKDFLKRLEIGDFSQDKRKKIIPESYFDFLTEKSARPPSIKKNLKKLKIKAKRIEEDLINLEKSDALQAELFGLTEEEGIGDDYRVLGKKMKFDRGSSFYQRRDKIFQRLKRLKQAKIPQAKRLAHVLDQIKGLEKKEPKKWATGHIVINFPKSENGDLSKSSQGERPYTVYSSGHFSLAIGTSSKANDEMRKNWAKKEDWWFHLDKLPGAHVIIKGIKGRPNSSLLNIAASLMAENSQQAFLSEIPILYTQVKNLKGVKGKPGSVNFKKESYYQALKVDWKKMLESEGK